MKIGITCYPSIGGSGILASALGEELARRGHEVHFISYERPFRMPVECAATFFPSGGDQRLRIIQVSRLYITALGENGGSEPRPSTRRSSCSLRRAPCHRGDSRAFNVAARATTARRYHFTWHRHHVARLRSRLRPGHPPRADLLGRGYDRFGVFETGDPEGARLYGPMEVIHNFFEPRAPQRSREEMRHELGLRDEVMVASFLKSATPQAH